MKGSLFGDLLVMDDMDGDVVGWGWVEEMGWGWVEDVGWRALNHDMIKFQNIFKLALSYG